MRFGPRNAYYLRISEHTVLPLYLYLDERHIDWMSERVLQHVLEDLRPRILPKLKEETDTRPRSGGPPNVKRGTVDVHRGDVYQFGYFFRETDPHSVLIKTRYFVPGPDRPSKATLPEAASPSPQKGKKRVSRKKGVNPTVAKKQKIKGKQRARDSDEDEAISISSDEDAQDSDVEVLSTPAGTRRRSARNRKVIAGGYREEDEDDDVVLQDQDVEMAADRSTAKKTTSSGGSPNPLQALADADLITMDESQTEGVSRISIKHEDTEPVLTGMDLAEEVAQAQEILDSTSNAGSPAEPDLAEEEEEDRKKLLLRLKYNGFNIHGKCLCVIVEPYPPLRSGTKVPVPAPIFSGGARASSIAPPGFAPSEGVGQRARTPLFLPEYDRERSVTPAPLQRQRTLPPVPLFNEPALHEDSDSDDGSIMQFSQILRSVGRHQGGAIEDDDEIEGAVLFGDADETREL
ncbi:uncharacterized protein LAESUDRAFT_739908 [Laetiporus sulphureus 93-53]|uniref:Uncharacterized protein n=1 Tax=Laetiporus sulphureus 93-53 TaxID=1314785 RepID=A0A165I2Q0_9APHY|nr:uncharacterized protein LAESUDRAFT_739908 [Laetiporus sulphureus 93-53]KZT12512.1 hypothetical protein LAESUDRAFT_739908 [Laetiporus sulphureus 93-53]